MGEQALAKPVAADQEGLRDFIDSLRERAASIERDVARLRSSPGARSVIASLFREVHNIKGDAALCGVALVVEVVHPIETVIARVRDNELPFTEAVAETLLLAIDRLELAAARLAAGESLRGLQLQTLVEGLESLAEVAPAELDARVGDLLEAVTGFRPASGPAVAPSGSPSAASVHALSASQADLGFFLSLASQLEARSPLYKGRSLRILRLALETNQLAGEPIDPLQLAAAVHMHDVGMMFLAESVWLKGSNLSPSDRIMLSEHPAYAAGLLARMAGWSPAAEMVAQHHEMPDGKGYPAGLDTARICAGARVLAIVDAFEAVMVKHIERGRNRSVLRAIAEINACDGQFAPEWISPFNRVIRRTLEAR